MALETHLWLPAHARSQHSADALPCVLAVCLECAAAGAGRGVLRGTGDMSGFMRSFGHLAWGQLQG